jgi:putative ABC transport system permease protein
LLLSAIGLYAVLSYLVAQRASEIAVRMALGAQRADVLGMIVRRGLTLALAGIAVGLAAAMLLTRLMTGMLYGVQPLDPATFAAVAAILLLVSLAASSAPAWRAARLDPMLTLRDN